MVQSHCSQRHSILFACDLFCKAIWPYWSDIWRHKSGQFGPISIAVLYLLSPWPYWIRSNVIRFDLQQRSQKYFSWPFAWPVTSQRGQFRPINIPALYLLSPWAYWNRSNVIRFDLQQRSQNDISWPFAWPVTSQRGQFGPISQGQLRSWPDPNRSCRTSFDAHWRDKLIGASYVFLPSFSKELLIKNQKWPLMASSSPQMTL